MSSAVSLAVLGGSLAFAHSFTQTLAHSCTDFPLAHCLVLTVLQFRKDRVRWKQIKHFPEVVWFHKHRTGARFAFNILSPVSLQPPDTELIWLHECQLAMHQPCSAMQINTWPHPLQCSIKQGRADRACFNSSGDKHQDSVELKRLVDWQKRIFW